MKVKLLCQNVLASPREITIDQFPIELGRGSGAGIRIDDRWLSRRHCQLTMDNGTLWVKDLASSHGTFVRGERVTQARLAPGDELRIGLSHFIVHFVEADIPMHDSAQWEALAAG